MLSPDSPRISANMWLLGSISNPIRDPTTVVASISLMGVSLLTMQELHIRLLTMQELHIRRDSFKTIVEMEKIKVLDIKQKS